MDLGLSGRLVLSGFVNLIIASLVIVTLHIRIFPVKKLKLHYKLSWLPKSPFSDCLKQAKNLMFEESMKEIDQLISQGRLTGYDIMTKDGINRSVHYTTRRFGKESLMKLYGISELPILHNSTRLALLIMREVHSGADSPSHRKSPSDIIGRA